MGYSTEFKGELKFKKELTASQIAHLSDYLGRDRRDIGLGDDSEVYQDKDDYWYHFDLEFNKDFSGLKWNGAEKTCCLPSIINFLTKEMRKKWKDFELTGTMNAQGEEMDDRWNLIMKAGKATEQKVKIVGEKVTCPHCEEEFILEDKA